VQALLEGGHTAAAMSLIEKARSRLAGTEERPAVRYLEALCLREAGLPAEAEQALRSLRNEWRSRDELWGKAGWLLGRCNRRWAAQLALSFYLDVQSLLERELRSVRSAGEVLYAQRHEKALEVR
jgi:hypothetical protein